MLLALELSAGLDLGDYSRLLWQRKISHHIVKHEEKQLVAVARADKVDAARELFRQWQSGEVKPLEEDSISLGGFINTPAIKANFRYSLGHAPLTLLLVVVCCVLWLVVPLDGDSPLLARMLYPDFSYGGTTIVLSRVFDRFTLLQLFQMLSPILLHGGLLHLVFNMSWLWLLGHRIERILGTFGLTLAVIVIGLCSNTIQYLYGGGNNFGGMSGVVYGLFAYIWSWQLLYPQKGLWLPSSLLWTMLAMLIVFSLLQLEGIADAAHIGGFLSGLFFGAGLALTSRLLRKARSAG